MQNENVFFTTDKYSNLTDEQTISQIKQGDKEALSYLLQKYKDLVNIKISKYFMIGAEKEDILQEGMIGLFKAIKDFNPEKQNSFKSFANAASLALSIELPTASVVAVTKIKANIIVKTKIIKVIPFFTFI